MFVSGGPPSCAFGNQIKYQSYAVGYVLCGPASRCQCAKQAVQESIKSAAANFSQEKRQAIRAKRAATNLAVHGVANPFQDRDKISAALIEKYGVDVPAKNPQVLQKMQDTNLARYGGIAPAHDPQVQDKIKQTNLKKYGTVSPLQAAGVQDKVKQTLMSRYGVSSPIQNPTIADKIKQTNLVRYGVDNASKHPHIVDKIRASQKVSHWENLKQRLEPHQIIPLGEFEGVWDHEHWQCTACTNPFMGNAHNGRVPKCPTCYPNYVSGPQKEIYDFVIGLLGPDSAILNDRTLLEVRHDRRHSKEIDIWIPSKRLAIEYGGLRWHTEISGFKSKNYHADKAKSLSQQNIQLITIWSDEWESNRALVKSMIATRLGLAQSVWARKLKLQQVSAQQAEPFFDYNHINGYVNSNQHMALFDGEKMVMCMAFMKSRYNKHYEWEISRLATARNLVVAGGASRLFKFAQQCLAMNSCISYCDLRYGTGNVYEHMGFVPLGAPTLGYEYVNIHKPCERINRLKFQKHKLSLPENQSVHDFLAGQGWERLWDCGHQKFVWGNIALPSKNNPKH
jgi:hypothetical protein